MSIVMYHESSFVGVLDNPCTGEKAITELKCDHDMTLT